MHPAGQLHRRPSPSGGYRITGGSQLNVEFAIQTTLTVGTGGGSTRGFITSSFGAIVPSNFTLFGVTYGHSFFFAINDGATVAWGLTDSNQLTGITTIRAALAGIDPIVLTWNAGQTRYDTNPGGLEYFNYLDANVGNDLSLTFVGKPNA